VENKRFSRCESFDQTSKFAQTHCESFDKTFSKVFREPAAKRRSPLARGEIPQTAFFFLIAFSFAPTWSKEKATKESR